MRKRLMISVTLILAMLMGNVMNAMAVIPGGSVIVLSKINGYNIATESWGTAYYGSYPQREIVDSASTYGGYNKFGEGSASSNYIVDKTLYNQLENAQWLSGEKVEIDGVWYKRVNKKSTTVATYQTINNQPNCFYSWGSDTKWHYFRYDPIRWRVLSVTTNDDNKNVALLLSENVLDCQIYQINNSKTYWADSMLRSYLNEDFYGDDTIFTSQEKAGIQDTSNSVNGFYKGGSGGDTATDKVFLLNDRDVAYSDNATSYGFSTASSADSARGAISTAYARCRGTYQCNSASTAWWWLRSANGDTVGYIGESNTVSACAGIANGIGVRPAMWVLTGNLTVGGDCYKSSGLNESSISDAKISLSQTQYSADGTAKEPVVTVKMGSGVLAKGKDYYVEYSNNVQGGTATVTVYGMGNYKDSKSSDFVIFSDYSGDIYDPSQPATGDDTVQKKEQSITKVTASKTIKYKKLKKASQSFKISATVKDNAKLTYSKYSGSKKITVSSTGKVKLKKGMKKGTYKIKVKVKAAETEAYNSITVKKTIKIKVK